MDDLIAFLNARLLEDEQAAKAVEPLGHAVDMGGARLDERFFHGRLRLASEDGMPRPETSDSAAAKHFARHAPGHVLADVAAKRKLVEFWSLAYRNPKDAALFSGLDWDRVRSNGHWTLRLLALPYADHPDYREEFKP